MNFKLEEPFLIAAMVSGVLGARWRFFVKPVRSCSSMFFGLWGGGSFDIER